MAPYRPNEKPHHQPEALPGPAHRRLPPQPASLLSACSFVQPQGLPSRSAAARSPPCHTSAGAAPGFSFRVTRCYFSVPLAIRRDLLFLLGPGDLGRSWLPRGPDPRAAVGTSRARYCQRVRRVSPWELPGGCRAGRGQAPLGWGSAAQGRRCQGPPASTDTVWRGVCPGLRSGLVCFIHLFF